MKRPRFASARTAVALAAAVATALTPASVFAWGATGHRFVGEAAMKSLPAELPGFLHAPQAALDVGEFSREPDRVKGAGRTLDGDLDPGHFLDLSDDGTVLGGPTLAGLPTTHAEFETALRTVNQNSWKSGFLPYSILENYQRLSRDFMYWRILSAAEKNPAWSAHKAFFTNDRRRRETQILQDIGVLSHFVGDGSQPLHVTVHFNGWGDYPNPNGFTAAHIHGPFEGDLVQASVTEAAVMVKIPAPKDCHCAIQKRIADYLAGTATLVVPLYQLEKDGGLKAGDPRGAAFATQQIAVGAGELRDLIVDAWNTSAGGSLGYRPNIVTVADVAAGKTDPYAALYGID